MPHWIALLAIVVFAWMILAVVGGLLIGRGLGAIGRHSDGDAADAESERAVHEDIRRAA